MITTFAKLDTATRDYLLAVSKSKGNGSPGIFVAGTANPWPVMGCLVGGMMICVVLAMMMELPKSAWAVAMLVTAGLWLGGWLVSYPFRRWFGSRIGTFNYFDSHTVYQVNAGEITITDISDMNGLGLTHNTSNNVYSGSTLRFSVPGRTFAVNTKNQRGAQKVSEYYDALEEIEEGTTLKWKPTTPSEEGAAAVYMVKEDALPQDRSLIDLKIEMPDTEATGAKPGGGSLLRYLILLVLAGAIYAAAWQMLQPAQDHAAFNAAKKEGVQGYRDYLLDDRNQFHRDEAKKKIRDAYVPLIRDVDAKATTPEYKKGLREMLEGLGEAEGLPVVSMRVTEVNGNLGDPPQFKESREKAVRTELADALGTHFGPSYITFVEAPADAKAHMTLVYSPVDNGRITWHLEFRATPDSVPVLGPERTTDSLINTSNPATALKDAIFKDMLATVAPPVNNLPIGGGDFDE
ncbi:hypothetical protein BH11PLA2_BH11PLA2_14670 [soil metagenome]